jgi:hypothetical protein
MCLVWISEQTAINPLYSINWLVFITETMCVYRKVRAQNLYTYVYLYISPQCRNSPQWAMASSLSRPHDHTRHTTISRTPLDEWSAWCRDLYLTIHNTHNTKSMSPAGFEPVIPANEQPQTDASDGAATGIGRYLYTLRGNFRLWSFNCLCNPIVRAALQHNSTRCFATQFYVLLCNTIVRAALQHNSTRCFATQLYMLLCNTILRATLQPNCMCCFVTQFYALLCNTTVRTALQHNSTCCFATQFYVLLCNKILRAALQHNCTCCFATHFYMLLCNPIVRAALQHNSMCCFLLQDCLSQNYCRPILGPLRELRVTWLVLSALWRHNCPCVSNCC